MTFKNEYTIQFFTLRYFTIKTFLVLACFALLSHCQSTTHLSVQKVLPQISTGPTVRIAVDQYPLTVKRYPLETYLMYVLQKEIPASWPAETLKAQAIVSRTYALYHVRHPKNQAFDLTASVEDQVFSDREGLDTRIIEAVQATSGQVLAYKGQIIPTFFHSTCGGQTERASAVWSWSKNKNEFPSIEDPYCKESPHSHWTYTLPKEELEYSLAFLGKDLGKNWTLKVAERTEAGRVEKVQFIGKESFPMSGNKLRELAGYGSLKSTFFDVLDEGEALAFSGQGAGHGVGLCQWGAQGLAQAGKKYQDILDFYYPGTLLKQSY